MHYKGKFLGKDGTPTKKLKHLLERFFGESKASYIEGDVSSWVNDLLQVKEFGVWINEKLIEFNSQASKLLHGT